MFSFWSIFGLLAIALTIWFMAEDEWYLRSPHLMWALSGAGGIAIIALVKRVRRMDLLSPSVLYMVIFWMFHFGLVFPAAFFPQIIEEMPKWASSWLYFPETGLALAMCILFLASFSLGCLISDRFARGKKAEYAGASEPRLVTAGWLVMGIGGIMAGAFVVQYGLSIFLLEYKEIYGKTNLLSWTVVLLSYGIILQLAGGRALGSVSTTLVLTYLPCAAIAFLSGVRTAPLFTGAMVAIIYRIRGFRFPKLGLWVAMVALLFMISTVRELRQYGIGGYQEFAAQQQQLGPLSGLTEMGGSLKPVEATIEYFGTGNLFYGETYILPFERMLKRLLGQQRVSEHVDERFIALWINKIYGSIGYSTVAEAYANGAVPGVIVFSLLWGMVLGMLEHRAHTPYGAGTLALVLLPMLINIRNSFVYVPGWMLLGAVPLLIAGISRRRKFSARKAI